MESKPVDDLITAVPGNWKFDEPVAMGFDSHVRKSVPFYDEVQNLVVSLSEFFVRDNSSIVDVGASTGETLHFLAERLFKEGDLSEVLDACHMAIRENPGEAGTVSSLQGAC